MRYEINHTTLTQFPKIATLSLYQRYQRIVTYEVLLIAETLIPVSKFNKKIDFCLNFVG